MYTGPHIVTNGLTLALDAGNTKSYPGSGTTWTDKSGFKNNGTLTNGPTYSNGNIVFDGTNDYIQLPISVSPSTSSRTFNAWINKTSTQTRWGIISTRDDLSSLARGATLMYTAGQLNYYHGGKSGIAFTYNIELNKYYNICATYDAITLLANLYVNGIFLTSGTIALPNTATVGCLIAAEQVTSGYAQSQIPLVTIYNRALTLQEIQQNYNSTKTRYGL